MQDLRDRTASVLDTSRRISPDIARPLANNGANASAARLTMTTDNRALIQRAFEAHPILGSPEAAALREFYADDFVFSGPSSYVRGLDAFSNIQVELREIIAEGERVVVRWDASAVHTEEFQGVPPSGDRVAGAIAQDDSHMLLGGQ